MMQIFILIKENIFTKSSKDITQSIHDDFELIGDKTGETDVMMKVCYFQSLMPISPLSVQSFFVCTQGKGQQI